ncbi:hypothetical protein AUK22_00910 [bacterium CG2_30_54_10]|nr:MAG: hypothetical protein AUK22_00910 [bacterium CG2_30_54_10]
MLVWQKTAAGSIREENQDTVIVREDEGVLLLLDGRGSGGRELSQAIAPDLERSLVRLPHYGRSHEASERLREIFKSAERVLQERQVTQPGLASSGVDVSAAVLVEGQLLLASTGTCGILAKIGKQLHGIEPQGLPALSDITKTEGFERSAEGFERSMEHCPLGEPVIHGPIPVTVGDWVMLFSEGLLVSQPIEEVGRVSDYISEEPDDSVEALFIRASNRYDGDDRSMILARFLPRDLQRRFPPDTVISTDLDRKFTLPLWQPLALAAGVLAAVGSLLLVVWRRLR